MTLRHLYSNTPRSTVVVLHSFIKWVVQIHCRLNLFHSFIHKDVYVQYTTVFRPLRHKVVFHIVSSNVGPFFTTYQCDLDRSPQNLTGLTQTPGESFMQIRSLILK